MNGNDQPFCQLCKEPYEGKWIHVTVEGTKGESKYSFHEPCYLKWFQLPWSARHAIAPV